MVTMPGWPVPLGHKPIDLGLERVHALLARLGNPHHRLPPVVHVAGTNGKGSTIAFMRAMLEAAGYRVHVYTSPHLVEFNERIILAGEMISDDVLAATLEECRQQAEGISATFFEGTTVAAFLAFSRVPADIVLLETGLGGRLDATNVIEKPALTIITPVSYDHMEFLGDTLISIAGEKAGIMKQGVPCVVGKQMPEVVALLQEKAASLNSPVIMQDVDWEVKQSGSGFDYISPLLSYQNLSQPALYGHHQYSNAGLAIAALSLLPSFNVPEEAVRCGLSTVRHAARMQRLDTGKWQRYLPENWELWLDGGHNPAAGEILAEVARQWNDKPLYLICGMLKDKDSAQFFESLKGLVAEVVTIPIPEEPKCQLPAMLCHAASLAGIPASEATDLKQALRYLAGRNHREARVLICGSLYLAGSVLAGDKG